MSSGSPASAGDVLPTAGAAVRTGQLVGGQSLSMFVDAIEHAFDEASDPRLVTLKRQGGTLASFRHSRDDPGNAGSWEILRLAPDLFVVASDAACDRDARFVIVGEGLIEFHFRLSGSLSLRSGDRTDRASFDVAPNMVLVWRQPAGEEVAGRLRGGERETSITLYMRASALARHFGDQLAACPVIASLCAEKTGRLAMRLALVPRVAHLVRELALNDRAGAARLLRAEALVMLILAEMVDMLDKAYADVAIPCRLSDADVRRVRAARVILEARHTPPPSIIALAREVGLSPTRLKQGFRAVFGTTVGTFGHAERMRHALDLLRQPDVTIASAAERLGYEHQTSFTAAFRRHFALLPKDYRCDPTRLARPLTHIAGEGLLFPWSCAG